MTDSLFLEILKTALKGEQMPCDTQLSCEDMQEIIRFSELHKVLPMVYDAVYSVCPYDEALQGELRQRTKFLVMQQTIRTERFSVLYKTLRKKGLEPIVVKGLICRSLYPKPDLRISADEDLLISGEDATVYDEILTQMGFRRQQKQSEDYYETSYFSDDGLHIELHTSLFSTQIEYFDEWNRVFENADSDAVYVQTDSLSVRTLSPTYNLIYLILHALKHFVHSGVGIRQVCDIIMFAQHYGDDICWDTVVSVLKNIGAENFTAGIFCIGKKYLGFDEEKSRYPKELSELYEDDGILLRDILCAGVYGGSSMSRRHSAGFTLSAVQGEKSTLAHRLFPKQENLDSRYDYAKKNPLLLPAAWVHRIVTYMNEVDKKGNNTPSESIRTGRERIDLLRSLSLLTED